MHDNTPGGCDHGIPSVRLGRRKDERIKGIMKEAKVRGRLQCGSPQVSKKRTSRCFPVWSYPPRRRVIGDGRQS